MQAWTAPLKFRRRSEVDRRLDELVGTSGRLKDASHDAVVRMLRLFNLCDVGPSLTQADLPNGGPRSATPSAAAVTTADQAAPMQVREESPLRYLTSLLSSPSWILLPVSLTSTGQPLRLIDKPCSSDRSADLSAPAPLLKTPAGLDMHGSFHKWFSC